MKRVRIGLVIKSFMIWLTASIILANKINIESDILVLDSKAQYSVLVSGTRIYSRACKITSDCFVVPQKIKFYSNQNILFSLCYQSQGVPGFGKLKNQKEKVQVCSKDNSIVDLDELMKYYQETKK